MNYKSPFLIVRNFLSPLQCEKMVSALKHSLPNTDQRGNPTVTLKGNRLLEMRTLPLLDEHFPQIEEHYGFQTKTTTPFVYEWYPTGYVGQKASCEGYSYTNKRGQGAKWAKNKDYDFTVAVFLNDYNDNEDFDDIYECRGGKLEFPTHDFGFNPTRGTMVVYPCRPNFVNAVSPIELGDLTMIRFHIIAEETFNYDMENYPGGYREWFTGN